MIPCFLTSLAIVSTSDQVRPPSCDRPAANQRFATISPRGQLYHAAKKVPFVLNDRRVVQKTVSIRSGAMDHHVRPAVGKSQAFARWETARPRPTEQTDSVRLHRERIRPQNCHCGEKATMPLGTETDAEVRPMKDRLIHGISL